MFPRLVQGVQLTVSRSAVLLSGSGSRAGGLCLRHAGRRSLLPRCKIPSTCPPTRCLSTVAPSKDGNLIYSGTMGAAIRGVKLFSYTSSGLSVVLMPQILLKSGLGLNSLALQVVFCGMIGFFTFVTPVLLHLLSRRYVIRLYHNPGTDTYTAITYNVFLMEKKCVFHQKQVRVPALSQLFTTFYAGQVGLMVNPDLFPIPQDYLHLMGYDKPFSSAAMDRSDK
ncbi:transmembrane protein 70, mitochondrial [Austrofundulus limnaeus]|uniref:Transmembrane protein 70, mitochondrial n=1 Tax=Austrofundulus limnaeus TaxID=52670 RepID=A0A2I4BNI3_AUSLI|nr:PREDICTED: transmembrane protein 70, mitochondrial [Austrofundulus limnaeus]